jgi:hypothetical protein
MAFLEMTEPSRSAANTCPLSGRQLDSVSETEIAHVFSTVLPYNIGITPCGHAMMLRPLLSKIFTEDDPPCCPLCPSERRIITIVDKQALRWNETPSIALRCGPYHFFLSLETMNKNQSTTQQLAQERAADILNLPTSGSTPLTLLHHGKIIFPDPTKTKEELSNLLLTISADDISHRRRPKLIVMGFKIGRYGAQGGHVPR